MPNAVMLLPCLCPPGAGGRMGANAVLRRRRHFFLEEIQEGFLGEVVLGAAFRKINRI